MTFKEACKLDNNKARAYLEKLRWGDTPYCPHCGSMNVTRLQGKSTRTGVHKCKDKNCRKQFTVTVGSIFEDSHIELRHCMMAFCLVASSKKGISALQVQRMLGLGSYKSAWHLVHRIRFAMAQGPMNMVMKGVVESDETWVGGKLAGMKSKGKGPQVENKTAVQALIERGGNMRAIAIHRVTAENLEATMNEMVEDEATLMTDQLQAYKHIGKRFKRHASVNHSKGEYSRGDCHVNSCESYFALLKRGVHGTFHSVGKQHLQRYCDEFSFRWNTRKVSDGERTEAALQLAPGARLTYKLTKSA